VERSAPSEAEKEAAHGIRTRDVGAAVTQAVMVHRGKKNEEIFWIMVKTWTNWNLIRELHRMSWP
jgi:hypothetical protein